MSARASTRREGSLYRGVLRDGDAIEWACPHLHRNRDMSPGIRPSARDCALAELLRRGGAGTRQVITSEELEASP